MKYAEAITVFTSRFFNSFDEPVWRTKSNEVAIRIARHLGPHYSMSCEGSFFAFHRKMSRGDIEIFNKVVSELKADKMPPELSTILDTIESKAHYEKRSECQLIEKLIEALESEKMEELTKRIEIEEEIRSKYRYR